MFRKSGLGCKSSCFSHCGPTELCTCSSDVALHSCVAVTQCSISLVRTCTHSAWSSTYISCMCNLYVGGHILPYYSPQINTVQCHTFKLHWLFVLHQMLFVMQIVGSGKVSVHLSCHFTCTALLNMRCCITPHVGVLGHLDCKRCSLSTTRVHSDTMIKMVCCTTPLQRVSGTLTTSNHLIL